MKTNKIRLIISSLIMATIITSCSEEILDLKPLNTYTEENIFSDPKLTEAYITKHYSLLKAGWGADWIVSDQYSLRFVSDEAMCNFNWQSYWNINLGEMTPDLLGGLDTWASNYAKIRDINIVFKNSSVLNSLDTQTKNTLLGEAHFFRAFYYMDLANKYGGVPILKEPIELNQANNTISRSTYEDTANFVVSEFQAAADLLPLTQTGGNFGRATKGAALALKARMLLYMASPLWNTTNDMAKWQKAADAALAVINLGQYSLDSNYKGLFQNQNSPEIIFQKLYTSEFGTYYDWTQLPNGYGGYSATCILQDMVDSYEMADGTMPDQSSYITATSNPWANRDPRFYASVLCDGQTFRGRAVEFWEGGRDSSAGYAGWNTSKSRYGIRKFSNENISGLWNTRSTQPWVFCRLAEVYLNYAEAKFKLGDEPTARQYLNLIRKRARGGATGIVPDITASGAALWSKIQNERKVELAFEDHRFYDVRRWKIAEVTENKPSRGIKITRNSSTGAKTYTIFELQNRAFSPKHYLLPIPRYEIQKAAGLEQNPGYN